MNKEQKYMLNVLKNFANGDKSKPKEINWDIINNYSSLHQVEPIIYHQCKDFIPIEQCESLKKAYFAHNKSFIQRQISLQKIDKAFKKSNVTYLIFKGPELAKYYPIKQLRTMGDIDILVKNQDFEKADNALVNAGFSAKKHEYNEKHFTFGGLDFELHDQLLFDETVNTNTDLEFCSQVWENLDKSEGIRQHMTPEYAYSHLLLHTKKHFMNKGIGFRQLMDIYFMYKNAHLRKNISDEMLKSIGLKKFNDTCLSLTKYWFEDNSKLDKSFAENATQTLFKNGVFGFSNNKDVDMDIVNRKIRYGKAGTLFKFAFPKYDVMITSGYYSFLNNKPYLLPVAWAYRFYKLITKKDKKRYVKFVDRTMNEDDILANHKDLLKSWGLSD